MSTGSMLCGAALSAVLAVLLVVFAGRDRRVGVLATSGGAAFLMPIGWNSILRTTGASAAFSHDLPFALFPVSWQDTGSGVFTLAGAALAFAVGIAAHQPAHRTATLATLTAIGAFLIDIYTY